MATGTTAQKTVDVVTPAAGESVSEGTILEWHVKVGDPIKLDETIVEISTDKVDLELPSPAGGTVSEILVAEGDTVTVGQVIARISVDGGGAGRPTAGDGSGGGASAEACCALPFPSEAAPGSGSAVGGAPGSLACAAGGALWELAPAPFRAMRAITWPTVTVSPSSTRISTTVPLAGAGSSTSTLSVEISTIVSAALMKSPTLACHSRIVPSLTDSPAAGVTTSTI